MISFNIPHLGLYKIHLKGKTCDVWYDGNHIGQGFSNVLATKNWIVIDAEIRLKKKQELLRTDLETIQSVLNTLQSKEHILDVFKESQK